MAGDVYVSFGVDTGGLESGFALAKAQTQALGREMQALARDMTRTGATADADMVASLNRLGRQLAESKNHMAELSAEMRAHGSATSAVAEDVQGLLARFRQFTEGITGVHEAFSSAAETFAAAFAVHEIAEWLNSVEEAAEKIERLSHELGVPTAQVQQIGAVAKLTGTDFEQMALALERMQLGLAKSQSSASPARAALAALNIEADHFRALPIDQQLDVLAEAFSRFADGPTKTAAAIALLNRSGAQMIPYLDLGAEKFDELRKAAEQAGVVLSEDDVKALAAAKEQSSKLSLAVTGLSEQIAAKLNPGISESIDLLTKFVGMLTLAVKHTEEWGQVISASGALEGGLMPPAYSNDEALSRAASIPTNLGRDVTVHPKPQVPEMNLGRGGSRREKRADTSGARDEADEEIKALEDAASQKEKIYDDDLAHKRISVQQWLAESEAALRKELAGVQAAYSTELQIAGLTSDQKIAIKNKEADEVRKILDKMAEDERKAADETQKGWQSAIGGITKDFDSQFKSVLSGSETWKQAMVKIFEDLAEQILKIFEQDQIINPLSKLLSGSIGSPANLLGSLGSLAGGAGAPLQLAGAAGGGGGILSILESIGATLASVVGLDTGSWSMPHDTLAMVHKGEMIVPPGQSDWARGLMSGGARSPGAAGGHTFNVHYAPAGNMSIDDVRQHAREFAHLMAREFDRNPSIRPTY